MTDRRPEDEGGVERGAAEEASGVPLTPTEAAASRRPPPRPDGDPEPSGDDKPAAAEGHGGRLEDLNPDDFE